MPNLVAAREGFRSSCPDLTVATAAVVVWATTAAATAVGAPRSTRNRGGGPSSSTVAASGVVRATRRLDLEMVTAFVAGGGMGRPRHQQTGFDAASQRTHVTLSEMSSNICHRLVKPPADAPPADATHDASCGGVKSCLLPACVAWWMWQRCHV